MCLKYSLPKENILGLEMRLLALYVWGPGSIASIVWSLKHQTKSTYLKSTDGKKQTKKKKEKAGPTDGTGGQVLPQMQSTLVRSSALCVVPSATTWSHSWEQTTAGYATFEKECSMSIQIPKHIYPLISLKKKKKIPQSWSSSTVGRTYGVPELNPDGTQIGCVQDKHLT